MKSWMKYLVVLALGGVFLLAVASADSKGKLASAVKSKQIVVLVYPVDKSLSETSRDLYPPAMKTKGTSPISPREKMPFEITPMIPS